jgi:hypothetical protein
MSENPADTLKAEAEMIAKLNSDDDLSPNLRRELAERNAEYVRMSQARNRTLGEIERRTDKDPSDLFVNWRRSSVAYNKHDHHEYKPEQDYVDTLLGRRKARLSKKGPSEREKFAKTLVEDTRKQSAKLSAEQLKAAVLRALLARLDEKAEEAATPLSVSVNSTPYE